MILGRPLPAVSEQSQERREEEEFPFCLFGVLVRRRRINLARLLLLFGRIGEINSLLLFLLRRSFRPAPAPSCFCISQPLSSV